MLHSRADALVGTRSRAIRRGPSINANKCHICLYTRERPTEKPKTSFETRRAGSRGGRVPTTPEL